MTRLQAALILMLAGLALVPRFHFEGAFLLLASARYLFNKEL